MEITQKGTLTHMRPEHHILVELLHLVITERPYWKSEPFEGGRRRFLNHAFSLHPEWADEAEHMDLYLPYVGYLFQEYIY